jgi:FkbM family methyltransferase
MRGLLRSILPDPVFMLLRSIRNQRRKSLSQAGQDFWVFGEAFNGKRRGFFLEIGSADGIALSNTFLLEKRYDWQGICIEANPEAYRDLVRVRRAKCLNLCVDKKAGRVELFQEGLLSTIMHGDTEQSCESWQGRRTISIDAKPLIDILHHNAAPRIIDYLSIDVEGAEERVLGEFPFPEYRFLCVTIERPTDNLRRILKTNGYILLRECPGLDCFYIHESFVSDYQRNAFDFWTRYRS